MRLLVFGAALILQTSAAPQLPPLSWTCPMHPDVVQDARGTCPICKMDLEPVRLDLAWSCPIHPAVMETAAGQCPICRRDLVQVTVALTWTCPVHSQIAATSPGRCPICNRELTPARARRPHGDHNPRHGGIFFMASDNWHHLEGTYPRAGVFRVFVYDDYTKPLPVTSFTGAAIVGDRAYALAPSSDGAFLEASVPAALPAGITARLRFGARSDEFRFDFVFPAYSVEPAAAAPVTGTSSSTSVPDSGGMPATASGLVTELRRRSRDVDALLQQGAFADIYVPALAGKDAALALETHAGEVAAGRRSAIASAVKRVVVAAWLLDLYGDLGNREKLTEAAHAFRGAVTDLASAYDASR